MRRVYLCGLVALAAGCCATRPADAQERFFGFGFRASRSGDCGPRFFPRRALYEAEGLPYERAFYGPGLDREELDLRWRRDRGPYGVPMRRPGRCYDDDGWGGWRRPRGGQWLLQESPGGRLRLWALDPDD